MPSQEPSTNSEASLTSLHQVGLLVHTLAGLILPDTQEWDSIWHLSNRVCDRYLRAEAIKVEHEQKRSA